MIFSSTPCSKLKFFICLIYSNTAVGAAFGTAKAGIGIAGLGTFKPELIMKASGAL